LSIALRCHITHSSIETSSLMSKTADLRGGAPFETPDFPHPSP
jgi:hypothetical protein